VGNLTNKIGERKREGKKTLLFWKMFLTHRFPLWKGNVWGCTEEIEKTKIVLN